MRHSKLREYNVDTRTFNILSICSGVGGLELGVGLAVPNARTVCYVESEIYATAILAERMAENALDSAPVWTDLRTFDGKPWRGKVDCIVGGYPCQPFSAAGHRRGENDPRHLWPVVAALIRTVEPPMCFFENVRGHLSLGFDCVARDLQQMGYTVKAGLFTAAEVGASHNRERLFILAYRNGNGCRNGYPIGKRQVCSIGIGKHSPSHENGVVSVARSGTNSETVADNLGKCRSRPEHERDKSGQSEKTDRRCDSTLANSDDKRQQWRHRGIRKRYEQTPESSEPGKNTLSLWPPRPDDREKWAKVPASLKPAVLRMADGVANRMDRIRACGNGVVPLAAAYAWRTLTSNLEIKYDENNNTKTEFD